MSGVSLFEFLLILVIGLIVLGPERLPKVASQVGSWVGQARRMTRVLRRQLEDELNFERDFRIHPTALDRPREDDTYSPKHEQHARKDSEAAGTVSADAPAAAEGAGETAGDDAPERDERGQREA